MLSGRGMWCRSVIVQRKAPLLEFLPIKIFGSFSLLHHGDAAIDGADQLAQIAPYTLNFLNDISIVGMPGCQADRLMGCVLARYVAESAVDAFIRIDISHDVVVEVQVFPMSEGRD